MANALHKKANKAELDKILSQKPDISDIKMLYSALDSKAEASWFKGPPEDFRSELVELNEFIMKVSNDLESSRAALAATLNDKADYKELERLHTPVQQKAEHTEIMAQLESLRVQLQDTKKEISVNKNRIDDSVDLRFRLEKEIVKLNEALLNLAAAHKNDSEECVQHLSRALATEKSTVSELHKNLTVLSEEVESLHKDKLGRLELAQLQKALSALDEKKLDSVKMTQSLKKFAGNFTSELSSLKSSLKHKADKTVLDSFLTTSQLNSHLQGLPTLQDLERCHAIIASKSPSESLASHISTTQEALAAVANDMVLKANISDICPILDSKASIEDTNSALREIHSELDRKVPSSEFSSRICTVQSSLETLYSVNCLGRWLWKSSLLVSNNLVPWDLEVLNTAPSNFIWEKGKPTLYVEAPGLYSLTLGFYAKKKPTVQVLVNGAPILSAVNSASYVVHHSAGRLKNVPHPVGAITGLTLLDFIALPAAAHVSLAYSGEPLAEGFLSLAKL